MKNKRTSQTIAKSILNMIDSGDYPSGTRLPSERSLALRLGVSRAAIREAEMFLEANGRVKIKRGSGVYVCDRSASEGLNLPNVTAFGLTQTRLLFESECAALAAINITDDQIAELEATIVLMANAPVDSQEADNADHAFHLLIAKATGNESNVAVLEHIWRMRNEIDAIKRVYTAVGHTDSSDRVNEHTEIMDALRGRNPIPARKAMRQHFTRLLNALLDTSEQQSINDVRRKANENRERYMNPAMLA